MTEVKVNDYERKKPHGGTTHVKSYWRRQEGSASTAPSETNFEDREQEEEEELQDQREVGATVTREADGNGDLKKEE